MANEALNTTWPRFWDVAQKAFERVIAVPDPPIAYEFLRLLEEYLAKNPSAKDIHPEEVKKMENMIITCKWFCMIMLRPQEVEDLFENHFDVAWNLMPEIDLWGDCKGFLFTIVLYEERNRFKQKIREIMLKNPVRLTAGAFVAGARPAVASVANWIADYRKSVGDGDPETLALTRYLTNGVNMRGLDARDRARMKQLFDFYVKISRSSLTLEGLEDDIPLELPGGKGVIRDGEVIKYGDTALRDPMFWDTVRIFNPQTKPIPSPSAGIKQDAVKAYQSDLALRTAIEKEEAKWSSLLSANPAREAVFERIYNTLAPAMGAPSVQAVMGALLSTAKAKGALREFLKTDRRAVELLKTWLGKEGEAHMRDFLLSPVSPLSLALFLRTLLERRLGLNPSESARLGIHAANALKRGGFPEYMTMARYNAGLGSFEWSV